MGPADGNINAGPVKYRKIWKSAMNNSEKTADLSRYQRQTVMPEIGLSGQVKLKKARVLIIGAGGLGSPAALYLAAAGIGTMGIMDADEVSLSNLNRQILHTQDRIGVNKAESAKEELLKRNDEIIIRTYPYFLTPDNARDLIREYDFVIDAVDNFETKFLINDACVLEKKPFCHAGVVRFNGQVLTYVPGQGPCFRCIFEEIPEKGSIPGASQVGIMGAAAGITGSIQAMEAIKYFTGAGELLTGKMLVVDSLTMKFRLVPFPTAAESCRVCGPHADITDVCIQKDEYLL